MADEQKPVAWIWKNRHGDARYTAFGPPTQNLDIAKWECIPLYTHPVRQPLTDDQITLIIGECAARHEHTDHGLARAIEQAHGIGGSDE